MSTKDNISKAKARPEKVLENSDPDDRQLQPTNFNVQQSVLRSLKTLSNRSKISKSVLIRAALDYFFHELSETERSKIIDDYDGP